MPGPVRLSLKGEVGEDARRGLYRYPVRSPDLYAGEVLALTLRQAGITIGRDAVKVATAPDDADVLATHRSEPLGMVIRAVNKLSSNFMAELVMHGLDPSRPVQPQGGLDRVCDWASAAGLLDGDAWLGNGSGLYDNNRMSAGQLTSLLAQVHQDFRIYGDFLASLAIMGEDGTTRRRLDGTEHAGWVRAKTGTLDGVSALSGYAAVEGRPRGLLDPLQRHRRREHRARSPHAGRDRRGDPRVGPEREDRGALTRSAASSPLRSNSVSPSRRR